MRTVSFADATLKAVLRKHFVPVWIAYEPGRRIDVRDSFSREEMATTPVGFGQRNVKLFVATADGTTVGTLGGYWPADLLARFLEVARTIDPAKAKAANAAAAQALSTEVERETNPERRQDLQMLRGGFVRAAQLEPVPVRQHLDAAAQELQEFGC